jgi:hypothetical protein
MVAGENKWGAWSWPEPTLPQKAREGWGNLVSLDSKGWGSPLLTGYVVMREHVPLLISDAERSQA